MGAYGIVAVLSFFVRQFILPNPFESLGDSAAIINIFVGLILPFVVFKMVGIVYERGDNPAVGSFLYLLIYSAIVGIFYVFSFSWWGLIIALGIILAGVVGLIMIREKL